MGCSQSKGDPEKESMTPKFASHLMWRFEEIKGRRNSNTVSNGALSRKRLLKHNNQEDHPSLSNSHYVDENNNIYRKSEASCEESIVPLSASYLKDKDRWEQNRENKATDFNQFEQERLLDDKAKNEEEESEAERRLSNVEFSYLCHRSLSFRVYCVDQPVENANDETDDHKDEKCGHKYRGDDNNETAPSADPNELPQESVTQELMIPIKRKGKKGGRFMKVMSKGKPTGAVKNLLTVTSRYHPSKARRHNPRPLPQRA